MSDKLIQQSIINVLVYFANFDYAPSFDEVYSFLAKKTSKKRCSEVLASMVEKKLIRNTKYLIPHTARYTLRGHGILVKKQINRKVQTQNKFKKVNLFVRVLSFFPQIQLIGFSGSCAMHNATKGDDVDFFIITERNRLWTGRIMSIFVSQLLRIRRKRLQKKVSDLVCLNMFFDRRELFIPKYKRNLYTAHEVMQMKPAFQNSEFKIHDPERHRKAYAEFLHENKWVQEFFPNIKIPKTQSKKSDNKGTLIGDLFELIFKKIQLYRINQHKTKEIITHTQLWFFPEDFEKKLRNT
ncbi:hypothetical protein A3H80_04330 [Candidatus Roizmanbacteria bacterium RIFCSPLOWO2_02_FULL_37_19]|uniref:Polymerase nucleotidyl transferase domain-containing protein n=1 Tax=Candidatus Roizmanbacteria bacterium RIFCSPHIGHO2_02_FULL_37_24 TaxID=1802037 RepID=A0A1F7GVJ9_9BACT|nr:MAG: hypothetical protein A2862_03960 [Candidatus Roizmanbacteria bacterium RIFCSPHIGHO2_01_FULL_38_41]OGK23117.1 MAG: hypothetical protein A3C24_01360 [Candidatus Roizmanbacteria bacterium RIFCSPHIGHO2_02_FULL_37_24]OGK32840.1 MAG: hypothetical protein A3E10_00020 [Candidatus Roizmanbacteria bacterium RIFCSPHIGHO2_12_FULL_37_23]OGK45483.1 MAG: hypothetical protein A2956_00140 [Candidatus Roizmanbacteria bacterium RIFCSPLOWO2_01_FULL_37_57]OGK54253.1 MAG: hypothetical protein A3H80_04330 [Ca